MNSIPVVRLEVEYMKHSILHAFADYQVQVDEQVKRAVDAACTPDNLQRILNAEVKQEIERAIKSEVEHFFRYGSGKDAVRAAVLAVLDNDQEAL